MRPSGPGKDFDLRRAREMSISWIVWQRGRGVCTMGEERVFGELEKGSVRDVGG